MQKINIQICQYNLIILKQILENQKDIFFQNTLYITILNLQNEKSKYYNLFQENELLQYLQNINRLKIYFNIYENLFRNQISHGWIDILYETKEIKTSITIPTSQINDKKQIQETIKVISFNEEKNLYDARIDMKTNLKTLKIIEKLDFIICETIGKKEIKEMGVPIKIDDSEINRLRIREILDNKDLLNQESEEKIKYLSKQMNKENLMCLSLNNLITNIFIAVLQINK